jgi:hypothetical protein
MAGKADSAGPEKVGVITASKPCTAEGFVFPNGLVALANRKKSSLSLFCQ